MSNHEQPLLTPDFYDYAWQPITSCELVDHFVTVRWSDGAQLQCYALWLAENSFGIEAASRESMIDPADLPDAGDLIDAVVGDRGELVTVWADGRSVALHPGWLRHVADGLHNTRAFLPSLTPWTAQTFSEPPTIDGAQVLHDQHALRAWLSALCEFGIARLSNTPTSEDFIRELGNAIGPIRSTNFGEVFDVMNKIEPDSTANTGLNLGQHADLPTRETPPGFQFLHCLRNEVPGGWSRMTDGVSVADTLRREHPRDFEALTTLKWTFFNRAKDADHRWSGPIIDFIAPGYPLTMRAFYPVRAFPDMARDDIPRAYAAMRTFSRIAQDERLQIRYPFAAGDLVGFDNRRILHGRDAFDPGQGSRWLRGCYLDQDDVYSRLRVLNRRLAV